jgi:hypothetical protein
VLGIKATISDFHSAFNTFFISIFSTLVQATVISQWASILGFSEDTEGKTNCNSDSFSSSTLTTQISIDTRYGHGFSPHAKQANNSAADPSLVSPTLI